MATLIQLTIAVVMLRLTVWLLFDDDDAAQETTTSAVGSEENFWSVGFVPTHEPSLPPM